VKSPVTSGRLLGAVTTGPGEVVAFGDGGTLVRCTRAGADLLPHSLGEASIVGLGATNTSLVIANTEGLFALEGRPARQIALPAAEPADHVTARGDVVACVQQGQAFTRQGDRAWKPVIIPGGARS